MGENRGTPLWTAWLAVALTAALGWFMPAPAAADPPGGGTIIVDERFDGASVPDPAWRVSGTTCLTGTAPGASPPAGAAQIPSCQGRNTGPVPPAGTVPGYLQLTDARTFAAGSITYQRPIAATAGLSVVFEQYQYGGNEADGIGFFLVDGATTANQVGADGGSLGYAQRNGTPGVPGGYVGIGLDAYGNFYNDGEARGRNCPVGQRSPAGTATGRVAPNVISLRGPGNNLDGYCYLASTTTGDGAHPTSTLPGSLRGPAGTTDPQQAKRLVNVRVTPSPSPRVIVEIDFTGTGSAWNQVLDVPAPDGTPATYKFGFLGSTGGNTDVHLVRNVVVRTINELDELQLVKQVSRAGTALPAVITAGTVIPYEYVVTNAGLETVTNLTVTDNKVTGIVCDATTLPPEPDPGGTTVCRGSYTVTADDVTAGSIVNLARATASGPGGPVNSNDDTVIVPLVSSLQIDKTVQTPGPYAIGQSVTYAYTVTNNGGTRLSEIAVGDNRVPANTVVCQENALMPAATTTCTGNYTIVAGAIAPDGTITNTASATGVSPIGQRVMSPQDNAVIVINADVALAKSVDNPTPVVGENVTFTVTATNNGPSPAAGVVISDPVPQGLTYISSSPSAGTYSSGTGLWTLPTMAVASSQTLTLVVRVDTASAVTNGAVVNSASQPDPNPGNNSASAQINPVTPTVDIAVTKTAAPVALRVDQEVTFTISAKNNGPFAATGVLLNDSLPSRLGYVSSSATQGSYDPGTAQWTVGNLANGQTATLTLVARALDVGTIGNTASLAAVSPDDIDPLNDQDTAIIEVSPRLVDLVITKTVSPDPADVGDEVTYTVTAYNGGPDPSPAVSVREFGPPPTGLSFISASPTQGTFDPATLVWTVGRLEPLAAPVTLTVVVRVDTIGTKGNTVVIEDPSTMDSNPANNIATATLVANAPPLDIAVTKVGSASQIALGQDVVFTLTATNAGPNAATGLVLRDTLPSGLEFVAATGPGSFDQATGKWTIGALAVSGSVTLTITARAIQAGNWVNVVSLDAVDQRDTNLANNFASAMVLVVEEADLAITKQVVPTVAKPGDIVTYTVVVTNNGPNDAADIVAQDPQRFFLDFVSVTVSQGTFNEPGRIWTIGTLAAGAHATLTAELRVHNGGRWVNIAQISQSSLPDPNHSNNRATAALAVPVADLAIAKAASQTSVVAGGVVVFTVQVSNLGPEEATGVIVHDALPAGLTLITAETETGSYVDGVWTIGDLMPGAVVTLTITAQAVEAGVVVNTAEVTSAGPPDPDPSNNKASVTVDVQAGGLPSTGAALLGTGKMGLALVALGVALLFLARRRFGRVRLAE